jgi:hypothetical protein
MAAGLDDSRRLGEERGWIFHVFEDEICNREVDAGVVDRPRVTQSKQPKVVHETVVGRRRIWIYAGDGPAPAAQDAEVSADANRIVSLGSSPAADVERHAVRGEQLLRAHVEPDCPIQVGEAAEFALRVKAFSDRLNPCDASCYLACGPHCREYRSACRLGFGSTRRPCDRPRRIFLPAWRSGKPVRLGQ